MDFLSVLIIVGIAQGVFTISLIITKTSPKNKIPVPLLLIVVFLIWLLAEFLSIRWPYNVGFDLFYGTRYGSWLVLGPLFLMYIKTATGKKVQLKYLLHFLPFFILTILIPLLRNSELSKYQTDYGMLNVFNPYGIQYTLFQWLYSFVFIAQFLHFAAYLIAGTFYINRKIKFIENTNSDHSLFNVHWLRRFCYYLIFTMIIVVIFIFILFYTKIYRRHFDYLYALPMAFIIYALSYKLANASWPEEAPDLQAKKYAKSSLTELQAREFLEKLENHIQREKPYLNNGLRLTDLADELNIQSHHLSQIINELLGKSFFDYINEKRVEHAKLLIKDHPESTLLEIAFTSGFNNKNSFTNAFKKYAGTTPSAFKQKFDLVKN